MIGIGAHSFAAEELLSEWDGSAVPPVHRLPVFDEEKQPIVPTMRDALPMSSRWTCGTCHDYDTIAQGLHFNSSNPDAPHGRPGEPWVWVDEATGTALPLSYRRWPGTFHPDDLGVSPWRFTQIFGRSLPGGDMAEPDDLFTNPEARWHISGPVEINCMACHNTAHGQDYSEWARQMSRENFRWAATAAAGMGEVGGMATRIRDSWTLHDGASLDDRQFAVPPSVDYKLTRFDSKGRYDFEVGRPQDQNCLQCHSTGVPGLERIYHPVDVHTAAGMSCVDCHREDLHHKTIRAYEGEAAERGEPAAERFTCAGCHMESGDYGAPKPLHKGIPPVHFEKMTCTACHSGLMNAAEPRVVRTSKANRLGIYGRALWATDDPPIVETAFVRNEKGKIESRKLMWPSYWVRLDEMGGISTPLNPDEVVKHAKGLLDAHQQVSDVLAAFAQAQVLSDPPMYYADAYRYVRDHLGNLRRINLIEESLLGEDPRWLLHDSFEFQYFIADTETLDADVSSSISEILRALSTLNRPGEPIMLSEGKLFRRAADGAVEREDRKSTESITWGWRDPAGSIHPLVPEVVSRSLRDTGGSPSHFSEEQIAAVLGSLQRQSPDSRFGYVSNGKLFKLNAVLEASDVPDSAYYSWPIGHAVRPASNSLGVLGCTECHRGKPEVFKTFTWNQITGKGPLVTDRSAVIEMYELQNLDPIFESTFGSTFRVRNAFKIGGWIACAVLAGVLLVYGLRGLAGLARWMGGGRA